MIIHVALKVKSAITLVATFGPGGKLEVTDSMGQYISSSESLRPIPSYVPFNHFYLPSESSSRFGTLSFPFIALATFLEICTVSNSTLAFQTAALKFLSW